MNNYHTKLDNWCVVWYTKLIKKLGDFKMSTNTLPTKCRICGTWLNQNFKGRDICEECRQDICESEGINNGQ